MTDVRGKHEMTVFLMDDTACEVSLEVPDIDNGPSAETPGSSGELAVPGVTENLTDEIKEFMLGVREFYKNIFGNELSADEKIEYRQIFSVWNTFLQLLQGIPGTTAIISSDINNDISKFLPWLEERGEQSTDANKKIIKEWLPEWNMFLQARAVSNITAGRTLLSWWNLFLTIVGFIFYVVDLGSDIGTFIYYASNGQWWQAMLSLTLLYGAVIIHTAAKWTNDEIHCTDSAEWLRYVASLLVNFPDVKQYGALCLLEWNMYKSPASSAHLIPEWRQRRLNIAYLKFTEGVCEACPQAILQLCLLVPDLYGDWTWTDYFRIAGASVSLYTAGAAHVNWEKCNKIDNYTDLPLGELVVLHVWAVPVIVSRLLSVALLLSVHSYWTLAGVALHLVLWGIDWCRTEGGPRTPTGDIDMCLSTLQFFISPYDVADSITSRRVLHAIHFLVNTIATVLWALDTPLETVHPALYYAIICFNAAMFIVGLVGWQLHENYWADSYFIK